MDELPRAALLAEVERLLAGEVFARSPILSRLLRYLAEETVAGRAEQLKSYIVAVDGLGRSANFDSQLDSYPRVQMVRLRKILETHYASKARDDQPCVYLRVGSYRLRLGPLAEAYPALVEPVAVANTHAPMTFAQIPSPPNPRWSAPPWTPVLMGMIAALGVSIGVISLYGSAGANRERPAVETAARQPIVAVSLRSASDAAAESAAHVLIDGLRRSWTVRVRDDLALSGQTPPPSTYRLSVWTDDRGSIGTQLVDTRTSTVVWTGTDAQAAKSSEDRLSKTIARIAGPFGMVAATETVRLKADDMGAYGCLLRYFDLFKARDAEARGSVIRCLKTVEPEAALAAPFNAMGAFVSIGRRDGGRSGKSAAEWARSAVELNGEDPLAQFALARIAFTEGRCESAALHADRAIAANPYDIVTLVGVAGSAQPCGYPRAVEVLDRALAIRNENDTAVRGLLIYAAVSLGREDRLASIGDAIRPPPGPQLRGYLIIETIVAAAQGQTEKARQYWAEFRQLDPQPMSDDDRLRNGGAPDPIRRRFLQILEDKGVT